MFGRPEDAAPGQLLLANPFMGDDNFKRTVVLLVEHSDEGSLGFVLNRSTGVRLAEAVEEPVQFEGLLYSGGPVQPETLHVIHRLGPLVDGSTRIAEGVFWGGALDRLLRMLAEGRVGTDEARFFSGYSGWGPGQLAEELEGKSWIVVPAPPNILDLSVNNLWRAVLRSMGNEYAILANFPEDPRLN